ncbi:MAG: acyltransferase [Candidatus Omnitrophica bacterium]|nr:acyltransferase [Candidatus Omnitrophota bacterium]
MKNKFDHSPETEYLWNINVLKFLLIICIVLIHSNNFKIRFSDVTYSFQQDYWLLYLVALITNTVVRAAVPVFFIISGLLFFRNYLTKDDYFRKLRSRVSTIIVPLVFWNSIILIFLYFCNKTPCLSNFFTQGHWKLPDANIFSIINAILGITRWPFVSQFWFLRDLFLCVLIAPILQYLLKNFSRITLIILGILWLSRVAIPFRLFLSGFGHFTPLFFFAVGGYLTISKFDFKKILRFKKQILFLSVVSALFEAHLIAIFGKFGFSRILHNLFVIIWVLFFLNLMNSGLKDVGLLRKLSFFSFFIFATHEPIMTIMRKLLFRLYLPTCSLDLFLLFCLNIIFTISICLIFGFLIQKFSPKFFKFISGWRT